MELIPISHNISEGIKSELKMAQLYEDAGAIKMANSLREYAIVDICKENDIEIIDFIDGQGGPYSVWMTFDNTEWRARRIQESIVKIPAPILKKMAKIEDKDRLLIAIPRKKQLDPILFYELPYLRYSCIMLARWE